MLTYLLVLLPLVTPGSNYLRQPGQKSCPNLRTVNDLFSKYAQVQPVYRVFINQGVINGEDSVCFTFTEVDPYTLILYLTTTLTNGSYSTATYVGTQSYPGVFQTSSMSGPATDFSIGYVGCNTDLHYDCFECADDWIRGISWTYGVFTTSCLVNAQKVLKSHNLPYENLEILPMKLPPNCFNPKSCLYFNPFDCYGTQTPARYPYLAIGSRLPLRY